jgi:hypothetical protein
MVSDPVLAPEDVLADFGRGGFTNFRMRAERSHDAVGDGGAWTAPRPKPVTWRSEAFERTFSDLRHAAAFFKRVFHRDFANVLIAASAQSDDVPLKCPFTGTKMDLLASAYHERHNHLIFASKESVAVAVQNHSRVIGLFFPGHGLCVTLTDTSYASARAQRFLSWFCSNAILDMRSPRRFGGVFISHDRPNHYFYDVMPSVFHLADLLPETIKVPVTSFRGGAFHEPGLIVPKFDRTRVMEDEAALSAHCERTDTVWIRPGSRRKSERARNAIADLDVIDASIRMARSGPMGEFLDHAESHPFSIWLGFCLEKRKWIEQPEAIARLLERLRARHDRIIVLADGLTRTLAQDREDFRAAACRAETARLDEFRARFPDIEVIDLIGATAPEKIAFGLTCTMFVTSALTDSMWAGRFGARPGAAHASTGTLLATQHHPRTSLWPAELTTDLETDPKAVFSTVDYSIDADLFVDFAWRAMVDPVSSGQRSDELDVIEGPPSAVQRRFGRWIAELRQGETVILAGPERPRSGVAGCVASASYEAEAGLDVRIGVAALKENGGFDVNWNDESSQDPDRQLHADTLRPVMALSGSGSAVVYSLFLQQNEAGS